MLVRNVCSLDLSSHYIVFVHIHNYVHFLVQVQHNIAKSNCVSSVGNFVTACNVVYGGHLEYDPF
jgi:hypothetical protein